ncbi:MAG: minor capsid protein [Saccharofermentans sp.]|nr:minor capsid protein [Saccharofermentans sp.]
MMTIKEFIRWLESQGITDLYGGYIPKGKTQVLGVYSRDPAVQPESYGPSSYSVKNLTILVHWTKALDVTEDKAISLYNILKRANFTTTKHTGWIDCPRPPVDVDKDENGICEYTLDVTVYAKPIS